MRRYSFILSIIILGSFVTQAQPRWVKKVPIDKNYYIGIGSAAKQTGSTSHIDQARDAALGQIASGIAVSIVNSSSQKLIEQAGVVNELFQSNISSMAKAELEGYELVDSWENKDQYWVYYRLSKAKHKEIFDRKKLIATTKAKDLFFQGKEAQEAGQIALALSFYLQAAKEVGSFQGIGLELNDGKSISYIDVDVFVQLKSLLSSIEIQSSPSFIQSKFFSTPDQPILITVSYFDEQGLRKPVNNLPLKVEQLQGRATHQNIHSTDEHGNTTLEVEQTLSTGDIQFNVLPDIGNLTGIIDESISTPIFSNLNIPNRFISIQVRQVIATIVSTETNLGETTSNSIAASKVKQYLTSAGWSITEDPSIANFVVQIKASTSKGVERAGVHTAIANGSIVLICAESMNQVLSRVTNDVNGGGLDFERAGNQALDRLGDALVQELKAINI